MEKALAQRMLQKMLMSRLDERHEHRALPARLVRYQHLEVELEFAVDVVDVVLGQCDGVVQHVLEFGQHARNLPDYIVSFTDGRYTLFS